MNDRILGILLLSPLLGFILYTVTAGPEPWRSIFSGLIIFSIIFGMAFVGIGKLIK